MASCKAALDIDDYRSLLRYDLTSFLERAFYELNPGVRFVPGAYIEAIATALMACRAGEIRRLIINLPPRYLKSHIASIAFVAWLLGHDATARIICASYGQDLADKFARDCRTVMNSEWYKETFATRLMTPNSVSDFSTSRHGGRMSTSVEGVLTGRGGDYIIIDDPIKPEDALSETRRNAVNQWFENTLLSRLNNKETGCIIIIMQRLHQDDLAGYLLGKENWTVLSFPAIAEEPQTFHIASPLGKRMLIRKENDVLHPERESAEALLRIRKSIGEYNYLSQYQQNPAPRGGAMIKRLWLKFYEPDSLPRSFWRVVCSWDTASKSGELNSYSVCTVWGVLENKFYLLHVLRRRMNFPELKRAAIDIAQQYGANTIVIEDKASGIQLIQELENTLTSTIVPYKPPPGADKIMRMFSQTDLFESGRVLLPQDAVWLADYVNELTGFPGTKHDDQVDSTAQALDHMRVPDELEVWRRL